MARLKPKNITEVFADVNRRIDELREEIEVIDLQELTGVTYVKRVANAKKKENILLRIRRLRTELTNFTNLIKELEIIED